MYGSPGSKLLLQVIHYALLIILYIILVHSWYILFHCLLLVYVYYCVCNNNILQLIPIAAQQQH